MAFKPTKRFFMIVLASLAFVLVAYALLRMRFGPFLPEAIDKNFPDAIIIGAIGVLLWNKKLRDDAAKEEAEKKRLEQEAARAREEEAEPPSGGTAAGGAADTAAGGAKGPDEDDASR